MDTPRPTLDGSSKDREIIYILILQHWSRYARAFPLHEPWSFQAMEVGGAGLKRRFTCRAYICMLSRWTRGLGAGYVLFTPSVDFLGAHPDDGHLICVARGPRSKLWPILLLLGFFNRCILPPSSPSHGDCLDGRLICPVRPVDGRPIFNIR